MVSNYNVVPRLAPRFSPRTAAQTSHSVSRSKQDGVKTKTSLNATPTQLFVNSAGNNYHLSSDKPSDRCGHINRCTLDGSSLAIRDLAAAGFDIGAYEYQAGPVAPTVTSETPASGATGVSVSSPVTATFNEAVQSNTIAFVLKNQNNNTVTTSPVSYNSATNTATWTPTAPLAASTTYTATVSGAKDSAGDPMSGSVTWSFTTAAPVTIPRVTSETPAPDATGVSVSSPVTATFNRPCSPARSAGR